MRRSLISAVSATAILGAAVIGHQAGIRGVDPTGVTVAHAQSAADGVEALKSQSRAFVQIADRVLPSVVSITTSKVVRPAGNGRFFGDDFMQRFFEDAPEEFNQQGSGSGVIVSRDGYILTNNHVVANADELEVVFHDGRTASAELVGRDPESDLAVIRVDAENLSAATLGDSDLIEVGEWVLAAGNPFQLSSSITSGIVSAKGRSRMGLAQYENFIQTDAAINPGNSGGALVNLEGEVIGINTAIATRSGGYQGIGFAIPINEASTVMRDLIDHGKVTRGYLGVNIGELDDVMAEYYGLDRPRGALVSDVVEGEPADRAGIKQGDVISRINSKEVENVNDLMLRVAKMRPGTEVDVEIIRDGRTRNVTLKLTERPDAFAGNESEDQPKTSSSFDALGFEAEDVTRATREELELDRDVEGALVTDVKALSPAGKANLRSGDIIIKVDSAWIDSESQLRRELEGKEDGKPVLFLVLRGGNELFLAMRMPD